MDIDNNEMSDELTRLRKELEKADLALSEQKSQNQILNNRLDELSQPDINRNNKDADYINYYQALFEKSTIPMWEEDFSELKIIIDKLRKENIQDFEKYFELNPEIVMDCIKSVRVVNVNEATLLQMKADSKDELIQSLSELLSEASIAAFKKELIAIVNQEALCEFESIVTTLKNEHIYVRLRWMVFPGYEDTLERVLISTEDISERHEAEINLKASEKKFRQIFNNATDAIYIQDKEGKFLEVNDCASTMYGYPKEYFIGKTPDFLSAPNKNDLSLILDCVGRAFNGETVQFDFWGLRKNGDIFPKIVRLKKTYYQNQDVVIAFAIDIKERKKYEDGLLKAKEIAEESNLLKSEFLQNMSHEVKTPLNGILGFSELLSLPSLDNDTRKEYSQLVKRSAKQLSRVMEDIMEISRLETKQVKVQKCEVKLASMMNDIHAIFIKDAESKEIELVLDETCQNEDIRFICDDVKLEKILNNLIENAIKYTDKGSIEIGCDIGDETIVFHVKDTGIGIEEKKKEMIFNRFTQEDKGSDRSFGGLGLGLSIARGNALLLGGRIWLESEKGKGSAFYLRIPFVGVK